MMKTVNLVAGGLSLALSGCISTYHAWDGTKGYQEEQLEERQYRISYVAEQATRWDWLDDYLKRRCQELAGSHVALMSDITHDTHTVTAMSSVAVGAPVIAGGNDFGGVMMPVTSAPHEVVFNLKKAEGRCSF
ncbi:MAG: hypothetical protein VX595_15430 [Pseudomonadota bacterium]|uniref:hypothetical protein n=1 Tax=Alcanivorax sp. NBRC 102024 TaxID=1113895 RepID=UPI000789DBD3|nr:hypothetical protein [Alcanivorax sp. NBRC 102024]MEE2604455.1 hypothetical protein [Pseudomonadota bacterium]